MNSLAIFLWEIFVVFTIICLVACLIAYLRYHQKRGIDLERDFQKRYRYFVQPIYDHTKTALGYELLLREWDEQRQKWCLPDNVMHFPLSRIVTEIKHIQPQLTTKTSILALNLTSSQVLDFRIGQFTDWVLDLIGERQLVIELSATELDQLNFVDRYRLAQKLKVVEYSNVIITIEDVDSSYRMYRLLKVFLPYINYVKFNANSFNKSTDHWIDVTLGMWQHRLAKYQVKMILEQVENEDQITLADKLKIPLRQGYVYSRPHELQ